MLKNIQGGLKEYKHLDMFIQTFVKQDVVVMSGVEVDNLGEDKEGWENLGGVNQ